MDKILDKAIKKICSEIIVVEKGGIKIEGLKDELLTDEENVVLTELERDKDLQFRKLQNNVRYYYSFRKDLFPLTFPNIYRKLKEEKKETYERFKELIKEDLKRIKKEKPKCYDLYFPINIKLEKKISKFKFKDVEVDFLNDKEIVNTLRGNDKVIQELRLNKNFSFSKVIFCKISLMGRNTLYATKKAEEIFNFILGLISFYETYNSNPRTIIGVPKTISKLNQSYIFVFQNKNYSSFWYYPTKEDKLQKIDLDKERIKAVNSNIQRVIKSKQQEQIFKLFSEYLRGATEKYVDYSFLSFWRVIEAGILKEKSQKHKEIVEILKSLVIELQTRTGYKIDRFYLLRNNFVHEGIADINQYDRNGMKSFAQMIINIYLNTLYKYNTEEIKLFYYYIKRKNNISTHVKIAKRINTLITNAKKGFEG